MVLFMGFEYPLGQVLGQSRLMGIVLGVGSAGSFGIFVFTEVRAERVLVLDELVEKVVESDDAGFGSPVALQVADFHLQPAFVFAEVHELG